MLRIISRQAKFASLFGMTLVAVQLSGCASPAEVKNMSIEANQGQKASNTSPYFNNIAVTGVQGGSETNPAWTSQISSQDFKAALEVTLKNASLLATNADAHYQLTSHITNVDQPIVGINLSVKMSVVYNLKDTKTGKVLWNKNIISEYTAGMGESLVAAQRLRFANEGAVRNNFNLLLKDLLKN